MSELSVTAKFIRLCKPTLDNTKSAIEVGKDLAVRYQTRFARRWFVVVWLFRDIIDIISLNKRAVSTAFSRVGKEAKRMCLMSRR